MNLSAAIGFPFKDIRWLQKIGVGTVIAFIPLFGGITLIGW